MGGRTKDKNFKTIPCGYRGNYFSKKEGMLILLLVMKKEASKNLLLLLTKGISCLI